MHRACGQHRVLRVGQSANNCKLVDTLLSMVFVFLSSPCIPLLTNQTCMSNDGTIDCDHDMQDRNGGAGVNMGELCASRRFG